jgi:hypothetical protein
MKIAIALIAVCGCLGALQVSAQEPLPTSCEQQFTVRCFAQRNCQGVPLNQPLNDFLKECDTNIYAREHATMAQMIACGCKKRGKWAPCGKGCDKPKTPNLAVIWADTPLARPTPIKH